MNVQIYYFPVDPIVLPSLTFCLTVAAFCKSSFACLNHKTTRELYQSGLKFEELFSNSMKIASNNRHEEISTNSPNFRAALTRYIFNQKFCYHFNLTTIMHPLEYTHQHAKETAFSSVFAITNSESNGRKDENFTFKGSFEVYLNPSDKLVHKQTVSPITLGIEQLFVTYKRRFLTFLKWPYRSNCRDYKGQRLVSQQTCIRKCILKKAFRERNMVPYSVPYLEEDDKLIYTNWNETILETFCGGLCTQIACEEEDFNGLVVEKKRCDHRLLALQVPSQPDLIAVYKAQMNIIELAAFLGSILGQRLGFTIISFFDNISELIMFRRFA